MHINTNHIDNEKQEDINNTSNNNNEILSSSLIAIDTNKHIYNNSNDNNEYQLLIHAFSEENHNANFDWKLFYGKGFDIIL